MPSSVNVVPKNTILNSIEKPSKNSWITSGHIGSRDAVLVFRTKILNAPDEEAPPSPTPSSSSHAHVKNNERDGSDAGSSTTSLNNLMTTSLPSAGSMITSGFRISSSASINIRRTTAAINAKNINPFSSKAKVLSSLPKNQRELGAEEGIKDKSSRQCSKVLPRTPLAPVLLKSPKKRLHESLSSSENSISSECDDPVQVEEDIRKQQEQDQDQDDADNDDDDDDDDDDDNDDDGDDDDYDDGGDDDEDNQKNVVPQSIPSLPPFNQFDNKENLSEDCDDCAESSDLPAAKLKITYKFINSETKLLKKIFLRHGLTEVDDEQNFNILWTGVHMKPDILRNLAPYQRVNHFPRSYELTRKDRLYKNIERMQHLRGFKHFDIVPQSFVLPTEYRDLVSAHNKYRGPWIVKPAASSRGRGIFIVNSPDQIPQDEQVLVSKYVADPLCIDGHKCDLRVYVLVTSFDPLIIYIYEEGIVRLATVKYNRSVENLWNPCMHLCNYSINKYHSDYIKSSDAQDEDVGHKWTLSALLRHLKSQGCNTRQLMSNIEDIIIKSILACAQSIISACRMFVPSGNNCFELFGYDILIDDTLKPWLLEINLSPSMGVDSPLDTKVKASLMADLLTCVGIPAYSPLMRSHYDSKWTRFRNVSVGRRTNSADTLTSHSKRSSGGGGQQQSPAPLTAEEQRIIRNVKLQNARRGGFVRIFPTEDSMQRYGTFLDADTGIPVSTSSAQGQVAYSMILPHNFNQMLFNHLYGKGIKGRGGTKEDNSCRERMSQYERVLETAIPISFGKKQAEPKCLEEGKRLRKQIRKLIESGSEMTQLQSRQAFSLYLQAILRRLIHEPRDYHEKLILKFLNRASGGIKAPVFLKNPRVISKDRTAMVAKLLGDYLEQYIRDTEAYIDPFDNYGMIPIGLFNDFLSQAQEADLESVLTLHTSLTQSMTFLYNRCGSSVPVTPPIPSGQHGFLRALPSMVAGGSGADEVRKIESFFKTTCETNSTSTAKTPATATKRATNDKLPDAGKVTGNKRISMKR